MLNSLKNRQFFISAGIIFLALAAGGGVYWQLAATRQTPTTSSADTNDSSELSSIVSQIKQLVDIPSNETPTVAEITNQDKVRAQPFFVSAQTGDKVLIFADSKKVILYRPSTGKVINIASLSDEGSSSAQFESSPSAQESLSMVIRNGTKKGGLAGNFEIQAKLAIAQLKTSKENAGKSDYEKSVLVVVDQKAGPEAKILSDKLKIPIGPLPEGEKTASQSGIIIILGKDKVE